MKKNLFKKVAFGVLVFLSSEAFFTQGSDKNVKQKIVDERGNVSLVSFNEKSTYHKDN